jgi:hypothetical protein
MANGRCRMHGGRAVSGRANGAFRLGRYTKQALLDREQAKLMRLEAAQDARDGFVSLAKKKLADATALELAWIARFHPVNTRGEVFYVPTRRPPIRRKRREFPDGYTNIKNPMNSGRFTRAAKAQRAAAAAAVAMAFARVAAMPRKRKPMDRERALRFAQMGREAQRRKREAQHRKRLIALDEAAERKADLLEAQASWRSRKRPQPAKEPKNT